MSFPQVAREGYLQRLTTILKRWKSSYCYLYHTGEFVYHESRGGTVEGRLYTKIGGLTVHSGVTYQSPRKPEGVDMYSMLVFVENNGTETYFLAKDAEDARLWKAAIDSQMGVSAAPGGAYPGAAPPIPGAGAAPPPIPGAAAAPVGFKTDMPPAYPGGQPAGGYPAQQPAAYPAQQQTTYPGQQPAAYPGQQPTAYPGQQPTAYPGQPQSAYPTQQPVQYPTAYPGAQAQVVANPTHVASTTTVHLAAGYPRRHGHSSVSGFGVGLALGAGLGLAADHHRHHHIHHHDFGHHHHHFGHFDHHDLHHDLHHDFHHDLHHDLHHDFHHDFDHDHHFD